MAWIIKIIKWIVILGILVGGAIALKLTVFTKEPVEVSLHLVGRGLVERTVTNSRAGTVKTRRRSRLSPEVSGRIMEIPFREGKRVEEGDVLVRLDPSSAMAALHLGNMQLETAGAEVEEVRARREQVARELERKTKLFEDGAISEEIVDDFRSRYKVIVAAVTAAEARVEAARAAVDRARVEKEKTEVRAPFSGVVSAVYAEVGELATPMNSPGDIAIRAGPILEVVNLDRLYVRAEIDEVDMGELEENLPVRITLDPFPDTSFAGRVTRVAPIVSDIQEKNRTVEIEVVFDRPEDSDSLLPGTSADVEVILESHESSVRIPSHALLEGDRVLMLNGSHLVARNLEIGLRNWDFVEVISGLEEGEQVVVNLDREEIKIGAEAVGTSEEKE
ncbi:MAG: efflux RND transporter periplasmic adaptor subunit [Planctomycetota bacterium]|nr:efflux RND transporter periplasmic adaptor subunit [Planctomycetota bacterium]